MKRSAAPRSSRLFLECRHPGVDPGVGVGAAVGVGDGAAPLLVGFSEPEGPTGGACGCAGGVGRPVVFDRSAGSGSAEYLGEGVVGVICTGGQHEARHTVGQCEQPDPTSAKETATRLVGLRARFLAEAGEQCSRRCREGQSLLDKARSESILAQKRFVRAPKSLAPIWSLKTAAWAKRPSPSSY